MKNSRCDNGGNNTNTILPCILDCIRLDELLANEFCNTDIIARPGIRNEAKSTPGKTSTCPRSVCANTNRYSSAVSTGANTVCTATFQKRSHSFKNNVQKPVTGEP